MNTNNKFLYTQFKNLIWFIVPKTATRTMHTYFKEHKLDFPTESKNYETLPDEYTDCFKFVFVRNPWDRLLSTWKDKVETQWTKWSRQEPKEYHKWRIGRFEKYKNKDFNFFVKDVIPSEDRHTELQINLFHTDVNFIGRFENFKKDFNTLCEKIGIPHQQLPHKNKTEHKHYTEYYDDETKSIVAEKYAKDIEYLNYKFGE